MNGIRVVENQLAEVKSQCQYRLGVADTLRKQNGDQQNIINACLLRQNQAPVIRTFLAAHDINPSFAQAEYVLTTNILRTAVELVLTCDVPIVETHHLLMTEDGGGIQMGGTRRISERQVEIETTSPAWTPSNPIWVTILLRKPLDRNPYCTFKPK